MPTSLIQFTGLEHAENIGRFFTVPWSILSPCSYPPRARLLSAVSLTTQLEPVYIFMGLMLTCG